MKYSKSNPPMKCMMTQSTCYKGTKKMTVKGVLWHSTGANNPTLKRYVQPDDGAPDRAELLSKLGTNANKNDWNHIDTQAGLNAWIGKLYAVKANVFLYLKSCPKQFDVIFSDAPYDLAGSEQVVRLVLENDLLRPEGVLIFEHSKKMNFSAYPEFWQQRSYGSVQFSFFRRQ